MKIAKIIGVHSSVNGSYCLDCFQAMVKPEVLMEIDRVASFNVWRNAQEAYTISCYDTKLKKIVGDVVEVIRDDREDVDRQNMDDYPQGLVCKSRGCDEVIVSRWEDDGNMIHFKDRSRYGLVYKIGHGPIDAQYATINDDGKEVVLTDVMSGTDDYYEIDSLFESHASIKGTVSAKTTIKMDVYIHDRNEYFVVMGDERVPVELSVDEKWQFC